MSSLFDAESQSLNSSEKGSMNLQLLDEKEDCKNAMKMKSFVKKVMDRQRKRSRTWDVIVSDLNQATEKDQKSKEEDLRTTRIRKQAAKMVEEDNMEGILRLISDENDSIMDDEDKEPLTLESPCLSEPKKNMTLLHLALEENRANVSAHMISYCSGEYLMKTYTNLEKQSPPSCKSCIHILAELGSLELTEHFLSRLRKHFPRVPAVTHNIFLLVNNDLIEDQVLKFVNETVVTKLPNGKTRMNAAHLAVVNGHHKLLELLSKYEVDLDAKDSNEETPLMWAVRKGNHETFRELIRLGVDLNTTDKSKSTALHLAIITGQTEMAEVLINDTRMDLNIERIKKPRWVIEMVAEKNQVQLMNKLMQPENRKRLNPSSINGALFLAAKHGLDQIVEVIISEVQSLTNIEDDDGNTPIMVATENGQLRVVQLLVDKYKADLRVTNELRETVYDVAMLQNSAELLQYLMDRSDRVLKPTYLHSAAASGNTDKIDFIVSAGLSLLEPDANNNTIFHTAAANNADLVLKYYLHKDDDLTDLQNKDGETPLHIAARRGNIECVKALLSLNAKVNISDRRNQNPLHVAVSTASAGVEIISLLVQRMKETDDTLLNEQDQDGNTGLHLAVLFRRDEMLEHLRDVDPEIENIKGEKALRVAVKYSSVQVVKTLLKLFYDFRRKNVDKKDKDGKTALIDSIEGGDSRKTELLLQYGADLSLRTSEGSTVMHQLIASNQKDPASSRKYIDTYHTIVKSSVKWYCQKHDLKCPMKDTDDYYVHRMQAIRLLTSELYYDRCNALQYASRMGTGSLLMAMLHTSNAYKFTYDSRITLPLIKRDVSKSEVENRRILASFLENKHRQSTSVLFDVTHLIPMTDQKRSESMAIEVDVLSGTKLVDRRAQKMNKSCLELIANTNDENFINSVLYSEPFRFMVSKYWTLCRRVYEVLMWLHVLYMISFTYFTLPTSEFLYSRFHVLNETLGNDQSRRDDGSYNNFGFFLVWPIFILMCEVVMIICYASIFGEADDNSCLRSLDKRNIDEITSGLMRIPVGTMLIVFDNLSHISSIAFGVSSITWFAMIVHSEDPHSYLESLSVVLILGWLHTTNYVKGFKDWNSLATILKEILIKDITRFIYIYIFVLISFGYAIHALIQADYHLNPDSRQSTTTIFLTFYKMLSPESFLEDLEEKGFAESGGSVGFLRAISAAYSIISTIVLMNLLIAMMNNTYTEIQNNKSTAWKMDSLKMALWLERKISFLRRWNLLKVHSDYDTEQNRWFLEKTSLVNVDDEEQKKGRGELQNDPNNNDDCGIVSHEGSCKCQNQELVTFLENVNQQVILLRNEMADLRKDIQLIKHLETKVE